MSKITAENFQIEDLINDYEYVGLGIFDEIFVAFIQKCKKLEVDLSKDIPPNFFLFYHHLEIPYRASIRT